VVVETIQVQVLSCGPPRRRRKRRRRRMGVHSTLLSYHYPSNTLQGLRSLPLIIKGS